LIEGLNLGDWLGRRSGSLKLYDLPRRSFYDSLIRLSLELYLSKGDYFTWEESLSELGV